MGSPPAGWLGLTSGAQDGAGDEASDGGVPAVLLLSQVGDGVAHKHVGATHGSWRGGSAFTPGPACVGVGMHTEHDDGAASAGEDAEGADVLLGQRVLDSAQDGAYAADEEGSLDTEADGVAPLILRFGHCCCGWRGEEGRVLGKKSAPRGGSSGRGGDSPVIDWLGWVGG